MANILICRVEWVGCGHGRVAAIDSAVPLYLVTWQGGSDERSGRVTLGAARTSSGQLHAGQDSRDHAGRGAGAVRPGTGPW